MSALNHIYTERTDDHELTALDFLTENSLISDLGHVSSGIDAVHEQTAESKNDSQCFMEREKAEQVSMFMQPAELNFESNPGTTTPGPSGSSTTIESLTTDADPGRLTNEKIGTNGGHGVDFEEALAGREGTEQTEERLSVVTLNCKNIKSNYEYVNKLQKNSDIIYLQETWLAENENIDTFLNNSHKIYSKSSIPINYSKGRPFGGCMWLINKNLKHKLNFITERISTVELDNIVIVGVYMRFNDKTYETIIEHENDIASIEEIIGKHHDKSIAIIGDFNTDLRRKSRFDGCIKKMIEKNLLLAADKLYTQKTDHTFKFAKGKSWIDHVLANKRLCAHLAQVNIEEDEINTSDHKAVSFECKKKKEDTEGINVNNNKSKNGKKIDWSSKFVCDEYERYVNEEIVKMNIGRIIDADESNITSRLDEFIEGMNAALKKAVEKTGKYVSTKKRYIKKKRWWDEEMTYIKQQINAAYVRRKEANFECGEYNNDYKTLRRHFRSKQREKIKLSQKRIVKKLEILLKKNKTEFWQEMKKNKKKGESVNIKTEQLKEAFSDLFNNKIIETSNHEFMNKIEAEVIAHQEKIGKSKIDYQIDVKELAMIIKSLRNNKSVGKAEISNEMIKNGGEKYLLVCVKIIIEKIVQFGVMPKMFNVGKIIPILKDEKLNSDDINNIRPITISDALANIFEKVVLCEIEKKQKDHNLQFGFKKNSSCNHAIFVLKETANFYNSKTKCVYACAIDASKAFDKINRLAMMHKMMTKTTGCVWRALFVYYKASAAYVMNVGEMSETFSTSIGVKQGGPLSPRLFSIYVEALIEEIESTELGTEIGGLKTGVIMYADDLIVMSDDIKKLQAMLLIIECYCEKWEIKINAKKTQFIKIGAMQAKDSGRDIELCGQRIEQVSKIKYLGVWIDSKLKSCEQVEEKKLSSTRTFNALRNVGIADRHTSSYMKSFMYKVYCRPILHYGVENLSLTKNDVKKIQATESTLIKYSLSMSKTARSTKLLEAMQIESTSNRIATTKLKFYLRLLNNDMTKTLIEKITTEYAKCRNTRIVAKSLISEVKELIGENAIEPDQVRKKIKEIKSEEENKKKKGTCGIVDSIRTCLENRNEKNEKMLKLLTQSYEKIKKGNKTNQ